MSNSHAQWRIEFAKQLVPSILAYGGIKAVVIAGSVARGTADEYSDIEIPIFWQRLPSKATRLAVTEALKADFIYGYDGPANEDQLLIHGVQVDLWHITQKRQEAVIRAVLNDFRTDLGSLNALDTIRSCIPLFGGPIVQDWKRRAQAYPEELAKKIIQQHIASFSTAELFLFAERNHPTAFYAQLSFLQQEVFLVLLALNRSYFPTFKWLYASLEKMKVKPESISRRFRGAFTLPYMEAAFDLKALLEDTLHLVEGQFPELDTSPIFRRLAYTRAVHRAL